MFQVSLSDSASAALAAAPERMREALSVKVGALASALQARVQQKLSGTVLNARSGALVSSIISAIEASSTSIAARISTSGDIKYAAIHEFGGTIPPHEIVPDKAKALAFLIGGKQAFATRVNLPAIAIPERSYLRSSLAEMADEIWEGLSEAVVNAMP